MQGTRMLLTCLTFWAALGALEDEVNDGICTRMGALRTVAHYQKWVEFQVKLNVSKAVTALKFQLQSTQDALNKIKEATESNENLVEAYVDPRTNSLAWNSHYFKVETEYLESLKSCAANDGDMVTFDSHDEYKQLVLVAKELNVTVFPILSQTAYNNVIAMSPNGHYLTQLKHFYKGEKTTLRYRKEDTVGPLVIDIASGHLDGVISHGHLDDIKKKVKATVICKRDISYLLRKGPHRDELLLIYKRITDKLHQIKAKLIHIQNTINNVPQNRTSNEKDTERSVAFDNFMLWPTDLGTWLTRMNGTSFHFAPNRLLYADLHNVEVLLDKIISIDYVEKTLDATGHWIDVNKLSGEARDLIDKDGPIYITFTDEPTTLGNVVASVRAASKHKAYVFKVQGFLTDKYQVIEGNYLWVSSNDGSAFTSPLKLDLHNCNHHHGRLMCQDEEPNGEKDFDCAKSILENRIGDCEFVDPSAKTIYLRRAPCSLKVNDTQHQYVDILMTTERITVRFDCAKKVAHEQTLDIGNWNFPAQDHDECDISVGGKLLLANKPRGGKVGIPKTSGPPPRLLDQPEDMLETPFGKFNYNLVIGIVLSIIIVPTFILMVLGYVYRKQIWKATKGWCCCCFAPGGCGLWLKKLQWIEVPQDEPAIVDVTNTSPATAPLTTSNPRPVIFLPPRDGNDKQVMVKLPLRQASGLVDNFMDVGGALGGLISNAGPIITELNGSKTNKGQYGVEDEEDLPGYQPASAPPLALTDET